MKEAKVIIGVLSACLLIAAPIGRAQQSRTDMDDARFAEIAKAYREEIVRPAMPEEAFRLKVQAEAAVREQAL